MSKEYKEKIKEIQAIEDRYGLVLFRMALTHLVDAGHRHMSDNAIVEATITGIMDKGEKGKENGEISGMSPELQCEILRCAAELAKFTPWTLFAYIKSHVVID